MEKYHKDILTISQRLKQLMSQQERQSEASLYTLLRSSQTQLVLASCSITKEELRATKLRYEGCGLEVISSSSEELQPGDKVNTPTFLIRLQRVDSSDNENSNNDNIILFIMIIDIKKSGPRETIIYIVVIISPLQQIGLVCQVVLFHWSNL